LLLLDQRPPQHQEQQAELLPGVWFKLWINCLLLLLLLLLLQRRRRLLLLLLLLWWLLLLLLWRRLRLLLLRLLWRLLLLLLLLQCGGMLLLWRQQHLTVPANVTVLADVPCCFSCFCYQLEPVCCLELHSCLHHCQQHLRQMVHMCGSKLTLPVQISKDNHGRQARWISGGKVS
jgi:hypothetical protein